MTYRNKRLKELGFAKKNTSSKNNVNNRRKNKIIYKSQYEYKDINVVRLFLNFLCIITFFLILFITKNIYSIGILIFLFFNIFYIKEQAIKCNDDNYFRDFNTFKEKHISFYIKNEKLFAEIEEMIILLKVNGRLLSLEDNHFIKNIFKNMSVLLNSFNSTNEELFVITLLELKLKLESLKVELSKRNDVVFKKQILFLKEKLK